MPDARRPERLRDEDIEKHQRPKNPAVWPKRAIRERVLGERIAAVEGHERFDEIAVSNDQPGGEHHVRQVVEVPQCDQALEPVNFANGDHDREHHRESGVNRAGHEIGREHRRMPARDVRDSEVETHDGVNREHERRRQTGKEQISGLLLLPMRGGVAPAKREDAVEFFLPEFARAIAHRRQIRQEPEEPKQN